MLQVQEFPNVDGHKIEITPFPARSAFKYKIELVKLFGAPLGKLLSGIKDTKEGLDLTGGALAIESLMENTSPDSFYDLALKLMEFARVDGKECNDQNFNDIFQGELMLVYKVIFYVIKVNYPDFFKAANTMIQKFQNKTVTPKSSEEK